MAKKRLFWFLMTIGIAGVCSSPAIAEWSTGFEVSDGYTAEATIVGVDGWVCDQGVGYNGRGIATATVTAPTGTMCARIYNGVTADTGFSMNELSATDRVGVAGSAWTGYAGFKLAADNSMAGNAFLTLGGRGSGNNAGVYLGITGGTFWYNDGGTWTQTAESYTPDVFYDFDIVVHGNGSGGGTWDLTISGGDLSAAIVKKGLSLRFGSVFYLDGWRVQNSRDGDYLYIDDMYITDIAPPIDCTEPDPQTIAFYDHIVGYTRTYYHYQNDAVFMTQDNGGYIYTDPNISPYVVTAPDNLVNLTSSTMGAYTTLAVPQSRSERYGQIMVRVACEKYKWVRVAALSTDTPEFPMHEGSHAAAGPDFFWRPGGVFGYNSGGSHTQVGSFADWGFHDVTINYDLEDDVYEVWLDEEQLVAPVPFSSPQSTIESIAIGAAWWNSSDWIAVLDYWHWKVSDAGPFRCYGVEVIPGCGDPGTVYEVGDINKDCYVDLKDIALFSSEWLECTDPAVSGCDDNWTWP